MALWVSEGAWPCPHRNFKRLASRTGKQCISVKSNYPSLSYFVTVALGNQETGFVLLTHGQPGNWQVITV